jgi:hypothetical protein
VRDGLKAMMALTFVSNYEKFPRGYPQFKSIAVSAPDSTLGVEYLQLHFAA